jgi:peptidyl-prolyl cis-trans isomerase A (cyclophilin A)
MKLRLLLLLLVLSCASLPRAAAANVVVALQSSLGTVELELFESVTPLTAASFLVYTDSSAYDASIVHRSVPGFVIQGGGYKVVGSQLFDVATSPPTVPNEPGLSNVRGTVAMAKLPGLPNSATTQWFVNLVNNTALDTDNGGFTVFGDVITGMGVVDAIAALQRVNIGSPLTELPVINWTPPNVTVANLVIFTDVARRTAPSCGDLNGDSVIGAADVTRIRASLANPTGAALTPGEASRGSVVGSASDCNVLDGTIVRRRLAGRKPLRAQVCTAAL